MLNLKMTDTRLNFWVLFCMLICIMCHFFRSWQMRYQIEALHCGSLFMCSFGTFNGCHGNGSQELIKNREKMLFFVICGIFKGRLWFRTKTCLNYLYTTHNHFLIAFPFSHANFGLNSNLCIKPLPAGV